jgi:hypothetical protein
MDKRRPKLLIFFAICNFAFAILGIFFTLLMCMPIYLGKAAPHHFEPLGAEDVVTQVVFLIVPSFLSLLAFVFAGIGLFMRKSWGFYLHTACSLLAILSVVFIPYAIISLILSFKPAFKEIFFPVL